MIIIPWWWLPTFSVYFFLFFFSPPPFSLVLVFVGVSLSHLWRQLRLCISRPLKKKKVLNQLGKLVDPINKDEENLFFFCFKKVHRVRFYTDITS